jgi:hypothetical protein
MNKGNAYSDKDRQLISDFATAFNTPAGQRVLEWMERAFQVKVTLEPEELLNKQLEIAGESHRVVIDPTALAKRQGLRAAYYKVLAMVEEAAVIKDRETLKK